MITENEILLILYKDPWFRPSESEHKKKILDDDGNEIEVATSYYHDTNNFEQILIRVSNHGTWLKTWVKRKRDPSKSLQNLSVVFSNEPVKTESFTEPIEYTDKDGNVAYRYLYFVVEQYAYQMKNLSKKDFISLIKKLKVLGDDKVFTDPFKKKPKKRANRNVLTPQTMAGKDISPANNAVNPRQTIVANNKEYEVDAEGSIIKDSKQYINNIISEAIHFYLDSKQRYRITESLLDRIIKESVNKVLRENKSNIETWYRGYNSAYGSEKSHLLWLTDDISYARAYGNRVEEITIDINKLNVISLYGMDELFGYEIDYLDEPTEDEARELIDNGYDAYEFEANQGMSSCLCMWDKSSIINRRELSRQEFEQIETYDDFDNQPWGN